MTDETFTEEYEDDIIYSGSALLKRFRSDIRAAAAQMSAKEARLLVSFYYTFQEDRIRSDSRINVFPENEPVKALQLIRAQASGLEKLAFEALKSYVDQYDPGQVRDWIIGNIGIGPIMTAGYVSNIDITKLHSHAALWKIAGQDPLTKWEKGKKIPWNPALKRLVFLTGQSFVKVSGNKNAFYGKIYKDRKEYETRKNDRFEYKEQAEQAYATYGKKLTPANQELLKSGKLPPGHIHRRSARYAAKFFLSHMWQVMYEAHYKKPAQLPYIIAVGGHKDYIPPPNYVLQT